MNLTVSEIEHLIVVIAFAVLVIMFVYNLWFKD